MNALFSFVVVIDFHQQVKQVCKVGHQALCIETLELLICYIFSHLCSFPAAQKQASEFRTMERSSNLW